jgi:hypothetical protein
LRCILRICGIVSIFELLELLIEKPGMNEVDRILSEPILVKTALRELPLQDRIHIVRCVLAE